MNRLPCYCLKLLAASLTAGILIILINPAALAYVTIGAQWPQPGGRGTPLTLTYSYENMFDGGIMTPDDKPLPADFIRKSIETALGAWASVVPIHFVEVPDNGLPYYSGNETYGQIRFRHIYINGPDPPEPAAPVAKAQAYFPFGFDPYGGDVEFDHGDPWQMAGTLHEPDILGAAIHEIGHSLGLSHTDVVGANMYWIFRRTQGLHDAWLHPDDINGMRSIYGAGVGSVTPLHAPEPASCAMALMTLSILLATRRLSR